MSDQHDLEALNALVADPDLEKLQRLMGQFNLFEALGIVNQELRHSNFLAWLLNPSENHGLGDYALRKFMMHIADQSPDKSLSTAKISLWDFESAIVLREWRNIDILIAHPKRDYVIVIENKTWTGEHSDQLPRYHRIVSENYPAAQKLFILLSPSGISAEDEDLGYLAVDYALIEKLIRDLLNTNAAHLAQDVRVFLTHYGTMLRRNFMAENETVELARQVYARHRHALDFIFNHKPDRQSEINTYIRHNFVDEPTILHSSTYRDWVNLWANGWSFTNENHVYLSFHHTKNQSLRLLIYLDEGNREIYEHIIKAAVAAGIPVKTTAQRRKNTLHEYPLIHEGDYAAAKLDDLYEKLQTAWEQFLTNDFPKWDQVIQQVASEYRGNES